jgi:N-acetylmuramoyl-L-alanine amidase
MDNLLTYLFRSSVLLGVTGLLIQLPGLRRAGARDSLLKVALLAGFLSALVPNTLFSSVLEPVHVSLPASWVATDNSLKVVPELNSPIISSHNVSEKSLEHYVDPSLVPMMLIGIGIVATLFRFGRAWWIMKHILAKAKPLPENLFDTSPHINLLSTGQLSAPVAFGRHTIFIPEKLWLHSSHKQMQAIIAHEAAHLQRNDPWWNAALSFLSSVCFFQPLNFLILRAWQQSAEELCDAKAARTTNDPLTLAQSILDLSRQTHQGHLFTSSIASTTHLSKRIEALLSSKEVPMKGWQLIMLSLLPVAVTLLLPLVSVAQNAKTVVLDAGHGGVDLGAVGSINEAEVNLSVAQKVKTILEQHGITVVMTRQDDSFVELEERVAIINHAATSASLAISFHVNMASNDYANGIETWIAGDSRMESGTQSVDRAVEQSLAEKLQTNLILATGAKNRGTNSNALYTLRKSLVPAVLIELGFVSNPEESQKLATRAYQDLLAETISQTLINFLK